MDRGTKANTELVRLGFLISFHYRNPENVGHRDDSSDATEKAFRSSPVKFGRDGASVEPIGEQNAVIEFGGSQQGGVPTYFVRDKRAGCDMAYAGGSSSRRSSACTPKQHFPAAGIGMATVRRIVDRQRGRVWTRL
jgi:hypothetical protein